MKQIATEIGKLVYREVPDPVPKEGEALIEVRSIGLCNSDISPYMGKLQDIMPLPFVMGHEFGGLIKEIKGDSKGFKKGDKVSVYPQLNCGNCYYCSSGLEHLCENQSMFGSPRLEGGMSELIAVPVGNLVKMGESFNIEHAGLVEPATVSLHAVGDIRDSNVVVVGTGAIGVMMGPILKQNNSRFIAMDVDDRALKAAEEMGADLTVNIKNRDKVKIIEDFLGEEKVDFIVLAFIDMENLDFALELIRKHGTIILMATPYTRSIELEYYKPFFKEIKIKWSICYSFEEFKKAAGLIESGVIDSSKLITKIFPFDRAAEAFEFKANNFALKVIISN